MSEVNESAIDDATNVVMATWALYRHPRYGTELQRSEVREIVSVAVEAYLAMAGSDFDGQPNG